MSPSPGDAMRHDMAGQPATVAAMFARRNEVAAALRRLGGGAVTGVMFVGRGSSRHAADYGCYLVETVLGRPAMTFGPSLQTRYGVRMDLRGWLAIAISQSGATPEIVTTTDRLREWGARTVAITNDSGSPLAGTADLLLDLRCAEEAAVPATKTVTTSYAALAVLVRALAAGNVPWSTRHEEQMAHWLEGLLADEGAAARAAVEPPGIVLQTHLARGLTASAALEGALKFREATGRPAEAMSAAEFLHGPIAAAGPTTRIVAYTTPSAVETDVIAAADKAAGRGAPVLWIGPNGLDSDDRLPTPRGVPEHLAVLPLTVRAQQLAFAAALAAGTDPDRPAALRKVTLTV